MGANGRSGRLYAGGLWDACDLGNSLSVADAACASVGNDLEVDLVAHRCTTSVVIWPDGRVNHGDGLCLHNGDYCSNRYALVLHLYKVHPETRRSMAKYNSAGNNCGESRKSQLEWSPSFIMCSKLIPRRF